MPLPTREATTTTTHAAATTATTAASSSSLVALRPEDVRLPECTFLAGQSGKEAKFFSRVPYQSGCNVASSNASPSLLVLPGAGTTTQASYPRYGADAGKALAKSRAGAENMGQTVRLADGRRQYVPSSVRVGDYAPTSYVSSQASQFRGVWFDNNATTGPPATTK